MDELEAAGLGDVPAEIRMTGCPYHCAGVIAQTIRSTV
jgi:sulfite reductase beta subunit-like hemoprotein